MTGLRGFRRFRVGGSMFLLLLLMLLFAGTAASHGAMMHADVHWLSDGSPVPGASATLRTNDAGATMTFHTNSLPQGAYTAWWVIWNYPGNCSAPGCGFDDLGNAAAGFSVGHAAGHVVGKSGTAHFGGTLAAHDADAMLVGPGLVEPTTAEIHILIRSHGDLDPARVVEQIHTVEEPCAVCADLQGAAFLQ